ncbi:hypothetical protein [Chromohalobacter sp. HP20-39]|uniref:hypothetical protein n=1 Tax=Chromohalobacter sp. HP20-39 TaxID=3079306 RepID=UPI00294AE3AD|nr:hypothetical protein [Chromohalobacter sp. HP20-39]MDV6318756.1 hypothetical protein [Chromohalobacter sp. HP20-39]
MDLDRGGHYCRHVSAMTGEDLHSKSAIAAELAYRDIQIEALSAHVEHLDDLRRNVIEAIRDDRFEDLDVSFYRDDMQPPKPKTSLARRDARMKAEALEEMASAMRRASREFLTEEELNVTAEDYRRQAEGGDT